MSCEIGRCSPCQLWQVRTWFRACECWCCDSYSLPEALDPSLKEIICDTLLMCDSRGDVGCVPLTCLTAWLGPTFLILEKHILLLLRSGCGGAEDFPECYLISECMLFVAKSIPIFVFFFFSPFPVNQTWAVWSLAGCSDSSVSPLCHSRSTASCSAVRNLMLFHPSHSNFHEEIQPITPGYFFH